MLKEIGKTDSFDRMISALKHSVDQHLNQEGFKIISVRFGSSLNWVWVGSHVKLTIMVGIIRC